MLFHHKEKRSRFALFSPEGKPLKRRILIGVFTFLALLAASVGLGILCLYFSAGQYRYELLNYYLSQPKLVALNVAPFVLAALLFWFISDRAWVGFLVSGLLCLSYSWAEYWKLLSRSEPIYAEELTLFREAAQMSTQYVTLTFRIWASLAIVIVTTVLLRIFFQGKMPHVSLRLILPLAVIALGWQLYTGVYTSSSLYNSFSIYPGMNAWADNNRYISRGGMYPFIHSIRDAFVTPPEGYKAKEVTALLAAESEDPIPEDRRVSVICVMYEAFADLSDYTDRITTADPYVDYHALCDESYTGQLVTSIFAGGTVATERSVLTGHNLTGPYRRTAWSYARYFEASGYALNGSHPSNASFYSRKDTNKNLGFPDYLFLENHYQALSGGISMDNDLLPEIVRLCREDMAQGRPVFSYNVTYQNHGPYSAEGLNRFEGTEYMPQGDLDLGSYHIVNNYLNGIADTGRGMMAMADAFRDAPEPVILVFFGDHKPWLGDQGSVYPLLGIDFNGDDGFCNQYATEYLFWANDAAKAVLGNDFVGNGPAVSPCFLMNELFAQCGWEGPAVMKVLEQIRAQLPVITTRSHYMQDGSIVRANDLTEASQEQLKLFEYLQYYLRMDSAELARGN